MVAQVPSLCIASELTVVLLHNVLYWCGVLALTAASATSRSVSVPHSACKIAEILYNIIKRQKKFQKTKVMYIDTKNFILALVCTWHIGGRWYTSVNIGSQTYVSLWHQGLYSIV